VRCSRVYNSLILHRNLNPKVLVKIVQGLRVFLRKLIFLKTNHYLNCWAGGYSLFEEPKESTNENSLVPTGTVT
jgi:hypothetical protein